MKFYEEGRYLHEDISIKIGKEMVYKIAPKGHNTVSSTCPLAKITINTTTATSPHAISLNPTRLSPTA
jgi:hypothetical protein